jgi:hypothetical protein
MVFAELVALAKTEALPCHPIKFRKILLFCPGAGWRIWVGAGFTPACT